MSELAYIWALEDVVRVVRECVRTIDDLGDSHEGDVLCRVRNDLEDALEALDKEA